MDRYINKIRDLLIDCMPEHWYKAYLYFDSTETGTMTSAYYYVKTPAGSIINYGDLYYIMYLLSHGHGERCIFHEMTMNPIVNFIMIA